MERQVRLSYMWQNGQFMANSFETLENPGDVTAIGNITFSNPVKL